MVKTKKNNIHLEVSNDVDLEFEATSTTSRQRKIKGETSTKTKNSSLIKAKPKKSGSFLIFNGKEIPLDNKSNLNKRKMLKKNSLKKPKRTLKMKNPKASSTLKKRPVASNSTKRMALKNRALEVQKFLESLPIANFCFKKWPWETCLDHNCHGPGQDGER